MPPLQFTVTLSSQYYDISLWGWALIGFGAGIIFSVSSLVLFMYTKG